VLPPLSPVEACAAFPAAFSPEPSSSFAVGPFLERTLAASTQLHSPRFLGHQVATPLPLAALFDLVAALENNGMAVFEMGPAASAMERATLSFLARTARLPQASGGVLTSGGSLGNLTALLAARQGSVDVWRRGLRNLPQHVVFVGETTHYSVARAARILGLGDEGVVSVAVDEQLRMRPDALADAIAVARKKKRTPIAVVASAGSTLVGAYDPLADIGAVCRAEGVWLHVDGAHGASLLLSERHRHKLAGVEQAQSLVWDAHKLMMMPALCTAVLFADGKAGAAAFAQEASYLYDAPDDVDADPDAWSDIGKRTVECTKRMMGLKLYACLQAYGTRFFADHVDHCCALATALADKVRAHGGDVLVEPECNIVCFRPRGLDGGQVAALRRAILADGRFYIVQARHQGTLWLRCALQNPHTTAGDLDDLVSLLPA
jgi:L-2,4-diaminobutyrate decarboxylase